MTERKCLECGSAAIGEARWAGFGGSLQPVEKLDWKGGSKILVRVCTECGHIAMKAEKPHIFN